MKTYSIYIRLMNPSIRIKIGELTYRCSSEFLDELARDYANTNLCVVRSIELSYRKRIIDFVDF